MLGIETDVHYQWLTLVSTYEKRPTPISNLFLQNITAGEVKFISRILGQQDLPVENIRLKKISTGVVRDRKHIHENLTGFREED